MNTHSRCNACGEGTLHPICVQDSVEYNGKKGTIPLHFSECDVCGAELTNSSQALENKRAYIRFKKNVDGVPLGREIAHMRRAAGLSQEQAARIFGGGKVAFSKYENDDVIPDEPMVNLLRLAIAFPDTVGKLASIKGITFMQSISELNVEFADRFDFNFDEDWTIKTVNAARVGTVKSMRIALPNETVAGEFLTTTREFGEPFIQKENGNSWRLH